MNTLDPLPLQQSARVLCQILLAVFVLISGVTVGLVGWLLLDGQQLGQVLASNVGYGGEPLRLWQSYILTLLVLAQLVIWGSAIWRGRQIFSALVSGAPHKASIAAKKTAQLLWVMLVWGIAAHALGTVVATWNYPDGQRALGIAIGSAQLSTVIAALLATFTAKAFALGAALWQDHTEVI